MTALTSPELKEPVWRHDRTPPQIGTLKYFSGGSLIFKVSNGVIAIPVGCPFGPIWTGGSVALGDGSLNRVHLSSHGIAIDSAGALFIADRTHSRIRKLWNEQIVTVARLDHPDGVAVDSSGNLYVAEQGSALVRKISGDTITTVIESGARGVALDLGGTLYAAVGNLILRVSNGLSTIVAGDYAAGYSGDNGPATSARLNATVLPLASMPLVRVLCGQRQ